MKNLRPGSNIGASSTDGSSTSTGPSGNPSECSSTTACCECCPRWELDHPLSLCVHIFWGLIFDNSTNQKLRKYMWQVALISGGYGKLIGAGGSPGMSSHRYSPYSLPNFNSQAMAAGLSGAHQVHPQVPGQPSNLLLSDSFPTQEFPSNRVLSTAGAVSSRRHWRRTSTVHRHIPAHVAGFYHTG